ncbi:MAG: hypothetical protein C0603_08160 [Denitrovibrio sp.]|nr:MAG: hypothetical protein C0603_08160 [Denitrovibrio sp.]
MLYFVICFIIISFFLFLKYSSNNKLNKLEYKIDQFCKRVGKDIIRLNQNSAPSLDIEIDSAISLRITAFLGTFREAYGVQISHGSFADHYMNAVEANDFYYLRKAHLHIINEFNISKNDFALVLLDRFIKTQPPNVLFFQEITNDEFPDYENYYSTFIETMKELDKDSVSSNLHWIELTDDQFVKDAFKDLIAPRVLARHVYNNRVSILKNIK